MAEQRAANHGGDQYFWIQERLSGSRVTGHPNSHLYSARNVQLRILPPRRHSVPISRNVHDSGPEQNGGSTCSGWPTLGLTLRAVNLQHGTLPLAFPIPRMLMSEPYAWLTALLHPGLCFSAPPSLSTLSAIYSPWSCMLYFTAHLVYCLTL